MVGVRKHKSDSSLLVIQFARFGDLMQAAPLINALALQDIAPNVDLLVNEDMVGPAERIRGVRKVWSFERELWLDMCRQRETSIIDWANKIVSNTRDIRQNEYNKVVNITHTFESAYIASMMNCQNTVGLVGERDQVNQVGEWERYFHFVLRNRTENEFNLVDIHRKQLGIDKTFSAPWLKLDEHQVAEAKSKFRLNFDSQHNLVAIQLGANHWVRRWSVGKWLQIAEKISGRIEATFVLVGATNEAALGQEFEKQFSGKVINLIGKTNLIELSSVVSRCDLVVGADTGTMHLAAALAVPTVSVFLGMARPEDTAPYGSGRVIFSPERFCYPCAEHSSCLHLQCHHDIDTNAVAEACLSTLNETPVRLHRGATYNLAVTYFDEDGCQRLSRASDIKNQPQKVVRVLSNAPAYTIGRAEQ